MILQLKIAINSLQPNGEVSSIDGFTLEQIKNYLNEFCGDGMVSHQMDNVNPIIDVVMELIECDETTL